MSTSIFSELCIFTTLTLVTATNANADPVTISKPAPVKISNCRIVLIDHVILACDRSGILKNIECKEGLPVSTKQVIAVIADEVAQANLAVAIKKANNDVDVRFQRKASDMAILEHRKSAEANKKAADAGSGLVPIALMEVEKLKLASEKATLAIQQAEHELEMNRLNADVTRAELATFTVRAEFDGVITRVFRKKGEAVRQGDPIAELVNTDRVRLEGRVGLGDLRHARQGGKVSVRLSIPDLDLPEEQEVFDGQITFVDLTSDPVTHETRFFAEVRNRNNILRAGLMAEVLMED
jgi:multidrug efflux pump subunit AcrA (membrane-fusion protein)